MYTKKTILTTLIILTTPEAFMYFTSMYSYKNLFLTLFVFPIALLFSLIIYFMSENVFRTWGRFVMWWVPFQILAVALTPESSVGYFVSVIDKQFVAIVLSLLFTLISSVIVVWKYLVTRRRGV